MPKSLNIISVSSELEPYAKTGGLGLVARSLPKELYKLRHQLTLIIPFYGAIIDKKEQNLSYVFKDIKIDTDNGKKIKVSFLKGEIKPGLPVYFVENKQYFSRKKSLYGSTHENTRFFLFNVAALELIKLLKIKPDIIQCHDWQAGLIPQLLKTKYKKNPLLKKTASVFTIHNLTYQFGKSWWKVKNGERDKGVAALPPIHTPEFENINFAKRAILNADVINTVSEQYAEEIMTRTFGQDLHIILKNRKDHVFGIINGIDYGEYNPRTDPGLKEKYGLTKLTEARKINKVYLQRKYGFPQKEKIPFIGMTCRITEQKGFDLLMEISAELMRMDIQLLIMGDGDKNYIQFFKKLEKKNPKKIHIVPFDQKKETSIYAGADMLLLPSRFEPCGLNQLISLRYGSIPIVHKIGGLADTVDNYDSYKKKGTGFVFKKYDPLSLLSTIVRATETYKRRDEWKALMKRGMSRTFSWEIPAKKYVILFNKAIKLKKSSL